MVEYKCNRCGYITNHRNSMKNHLNRKNICNPLLEDISVDEIKFLYGFEPMEKLLQIAPNCSKTAPNCSTPIAPNCSKLAPNCSKLLQNSVSKGTCEYCLRNFSRNSNLTKHLKICKKKKQHDLEILEEKNREIEKLKLQLATNTTISNKTTNNTNNTNNNSHNTTNNTIIINNYGEENIEHIGKKYLLNLLGRTHSAIPLLVEKIHFDPEHPENQNIKLSNKKLPYIKIRKNDKWQYVDRKAEILNLIDAMCFILSNNYEMMKKNNKINLDESKIHIIEKYLEKYCNDDKKLMKELEGIVDLTLINNS